MKTNKNIFVVIIIVLLVFVSVISLLHYFNSEDKKNPSQEVYNEQAEKDDTVQYDKFSSYYKSDFGYAKTKAISDKLKKVDSENLSFISFLTSYISYFDDNDTAGKYNFYDIDRYQLYTIFVGKYIDDSDTYGNEEQTETYIYASKFEKKFTEVTGITSVEEFFKDYVRGSVIEKKDIILKDGETTAYILPIGGYGLENQMNVCTDISEKNGHWIMTVDNYELDEDANECVLSKTVVFEISKTTLRIYGWEVK